MQSKIVNSLEEQLPFYLPVVLLLLLSATLFITLISPVLEKKEMVENELKRLPTVVEEEEQTLETLLQKDSELKEKLTDRKQLIAEDAAAYISQFFKLAEETGIDLNRAQPGAESSKLVELTLNFSTDFNKLAHFLNRLEQFSREITVNKVSIKRGRSLLQVTINCTCYFTGGTDAE
jgi:SMC interacting uncharacterized protein involved in chromosome segregation